MKLEISYSAEKDLENYLNSVVDFKYLKHGRENIQKELLSKLPENLQNIILQVAEKDKISSDILKYLNDQATSNPQLIEDKINKLRSSWDKVGKQVIANLEFIFNKKFPFDLITVYFTTVPICPYNYQKKYFYIHSGATVQNQLRITEHELNHFMFYFYYSDLKNKLDKEKLELLKESLTFFTNPEQAGKPNEKPLRDLYLSKNWLSLEEAIMAGVESLNKH
jgi:hypothetical protein